MGGLAAAASVVAILAAQEGCDSFATATATPGADAAPTDALASSDGGVDAGPFTCDQNPIFEATLANAPPSTVAIAKGDAVHVAQHLVLTPLDFDGGTATRKGSLVMPNLLAGRTGFRATFEYSVYINPGQTGGDGIAIGWATDPAPELGDAFGLCPSGSTGSGVILATGQVGTSVASLVDHATPGCSPAAVAAPLVGSQLLAPGDKTPGPWYSIEVTVGPSRVSYVVAELDFTTNDAGTAKLSWPRSFASGGIGGRPIKHLTLSARTGGDTNNAAHRIRNLKVYACTGE